MRMLTAVSALFGAGPYLRICQIIVEELSYNFIRLNKTHKTGTRNTVTSESTASNTATSPSYLVLPYKFSGFGFDAGVYGGAVPSNT